MTLPKASERGGGGWRKHVTPSCMKQKQAWEEEDVATAGDPVDCSPVLFQAPLFTVLVVVWVACGTAIAAWLLWDRHKQYEDHREEALGLWCKERALTLQQLVLAHAGQIQTLAGLISVMGTPGRPGKWDMGWCLNCNLWMSYLTRTAQTRPGNTGALACTVVRDAERAAFEREYGSIRDNTLIVSAHRPIYCAKVLELTTLWATNGPSNIDMFQRFSWAIPLVEAGRHFYTWPYPLANPLTHAGFGVVFPLFRNLPTNHSNQSAAGRAVYGSLAASVDVTYIAQKVLEELYAPDPSKSFELYDITDPTTLSAIVSPVPPHAYFRPDDKLPYMHPSPESETRPWEHRAVVPLEEMGGGVRKYEVWCRHTQPPSAWQQWGIPILIALFALLLVLLVLVAACLQRSKFYQTQQQVAEADRLRREAEGAEASKSMFVACMSHELRTPMVGIIGMIDAQADMGLNASQLADLLMAGASAKDALHLVNRVLDLAKLEAGKAVVDEAVIDVREWLSTTLGWHAEAAHSKGIELSAIVGDDCPTHVIVDPMHLSTMIKEITDNAVKFTTQGHVTVRVSLVLQGTSLQDTLCCQGLTSPRAPTAATARWMPTWLTSRRRCLLEVVRGGAAATAAAATATAAAATATAAAATVAAAATTVAADSASLEGRHERGHESQGRKRSKYQERGRGRGRRIGHGSGQERGGERCMLVLSCQDSGCGLPASLHTASVTQGPSYFSLLESREQREARSGSGAALGLVLVHQTVTLLKGELAFDSEPGCGSIVAFSVPVAMPSLQEHCLDELQSSNQQPQHQQQEQEQEQQEQEQQEQQEQQQEQQEQQQEQENQEQSQQNQGVVWHGEGQRSASGDLSGASSSFHAREADSGYFSGASSRWLLPHGQESDQVPQQNQRHQQQQQQQQQQHQGVTLTHCGRCKSEKLSVSRSGIGGASARYERSISLCALGTSARAASVGAATATAADEAVTRAWVEGLRVLVVDDTPVNLLVARRSLARWGALVTTASCGEEAVELIAAGLVGLRAEEEESGQEALGEEGRMQQEARGQQEEDRGKDKAKGQQEAGASSLHHGFDLVLMDLQMPGMDGFAAAAAIRALERRVRFETISRAQQLHQQRQQQTPSALCIPLLETSNPAAAGAGVGAPAAAAAGDGGWVGSLQVPIVALTADVDRGVVERCAEGGFDGVLQKPVDAHLLAAHLSQMHSGRALQRIMSHPTTVSHTTNRHHRCSSQ